MKRATIDLNDFSYVTGSTKYDLDCCGAEITDLRVRVFSDKPSTLYFVSELSIIPISVGHNHHFSGRVIGLSSIRLDTSEDALISYSCFSRQSSDKEDLDYTPNVIHMPRLSQDQKLNTAVQAMVRQQLLSLGLNPDGDMQEFGDGDLSFEDDFEKPEFGSGYMEPDPDLVERPAASPASSEKTEPPAPEPAAASAGGAQPSAPETPPGTPDVPPEK